MTTKSSLNLPPDLDPQKMPQHIAVIMDGNGRWATQKGLPRIAGHRRGAKVLKELVRTCKNWGIKSLTAYAFSTENWQRPITEVNFLMSLFERVLHQELQAMHSEGVRIRFIGDVGVFPASLQQLINQAMAETANNEAIIFNVAANYGGRGEIVQACRQLALRVQKGEIEPTAIDESLLAKYLYTDPSQEPDLLIRTSGEMRLSNFLLWQMAYTEIYFVDTLWPDFDQNQFHRALFAYQKRDRRFGNLKSENLA